MREILLFPLAVLRKAKVIQLFEADLDFKLSDILLLFRFVLLNIYSAPVGSWARVCSAQQVAFLNALIVNVSLDNIVNDVQRVTKVNASEFSKLLSFHFISCVGLALLVKKEFFG